MQEIKIPKGCKASIDFEKRVVVIESENPKFKRGDIIYVYTRFVNDNYWVAIYNGLNSDLIQYESAIRVGENHVLDPSKTSGLCSIKKIIEQRLATPAEQQLLFDALAKEGKKWNAITLQIEDIEKDILVPESIGIYRCRENFGVDGDGLYVRFNNNTQLLYYNSKYKVWCTIPLHSGYERVQCKLTPCKREDLKKGETAFHSYSCTPSFSNIHQYSKIIDNNYHVFANSRKSVINESNEYPFWYKVEPINK